MTLYIFCLIILLLGLAVHSVWVNHPFLGFLAELLVFIMAAVPTPRNVQPVLIAAYLLCVWPWSWHMRRA